MPDTQPPRPNVRLAPRPQPVRVSGKMILDMLRAFVPAAFFLLVFLFLWLWFYWMPIGAAAKQDVQGLAAPSDNIWTAIEKERLASTQLSKQGVMVADLRPWQVQRTGIGGVSYDAEARGKFDEAVKGIDDPDANLDRSKTEQALGSVGSTNRASEVYIRALTLHRHGQLAEARETLEGRNSCSGDKANGGGGVFQLIAATRANARSAEAKMRLDGMEIASNYLLGHVLLSSNANCAITALRAAKDQASQARANYAAYASAPSGLFDLKPSWHLTALSTGVLWNDYLTALHRQDAKKALAEAKPLYSDPEGVVRYPELAATLQLYAVESGDFSQVDQIDPGLTREGAPGAKARKLRSMAQAARVSAAAQLIAGLTTDMSLLEGQPDTALLRPWMVISQERRTLGVGIAPGVDLPALEAETAEPIGDIVVDRGFISTWRRQYYTEIGKQFLKRGRGEPGYYSLLMRSDSMPFPIRFSAAAHARGVPPVVVIGLMVLVGLMVLAGLGMAWIYRATFRPMHFSSRRRQYKALSSKVTIVSGET